MGDPFANLKSQKSQSQVQQDASKLSGGYAHGGEVRKRLASKMAKYSDGGPVEKDEYSDLKNADSESVARKKAIAARLKPRNIESQKSEATDE
jgi:hypothetical protein